MKKQSSPSSPSPSPSSSSSQQQKQQQSEPLKCPRCDSTNTKFCYYNNYNKSQPRHFCKTCKRHWTKGGTLRNVPVGGGRKNKRKMSNTAIKATSKTTTATMTGATTALISNFESNPCSISSIQSSNLYNYTGDQANNSLEETLMNSLNTNLSSSPMSMGDHQHQQSWSMATNTSTVMGMTSNWGWDDIEKFVSVDESELTIPLPWDDADIKP
ncbi:hypothetical protein Cgig2_028919 [Carnegiea gigantea]|uniref:Dof zinc finger protein n=1 Tax=Carnegiea gigantea TaxID=171969 RepID=A0A9Q1KR70_9CARY|nr:hypothetical protein Cgig2_028919 [Carnegiea gigantea]